TGNETVTSYSISDPLPGISAVDCTGQPSQLAPGGTATCHATYTVTQADVNAGQIVNTVSVIGQVPAGGPVNDSDQITVPLGPFGTLQIVKRLVPATDGGRFDLNINGGAPEATGVGDGGKTPAVSVSPKNANSVSEAGSPGTDLADYAVDLACTRDGTPIANLDPNTITVGLGEAVVCTFTNTLKPAGLSIAKSAPPVAHDGDTITYGISVSTSGSVPLHNIVVSDSRCQGGPVFLTGDTNGNGLLDTTETWNYSCTYVVQHGDEDGT